MAGLDVLVRELQQGKCKPVIAALLVNRAGWITDLLEHSLSAPEHPPVAEVKCTQCHELSSRGRFRFRNNSCFDCHPKESFAKVHTHDATVLTECGLCHNAHGSTVKAHLLYPKETACKQCHQ